MNRSESGNLDLLAASFIKGIATGSDMENQKGRPSPWLAPILGGLALLLNGLWIYLNIRHWKSLTLITCRSPSTLLELVCYGLC
jgi:hypothetical protein